MSVDPKLVDVFFPQHDGYPEHLAKLDTRDALMMAADDAGAVVTEFPQSLWIEPKDWPEWARQNDENKTWGLNYLDRFTNQNPTHECTAHSLRANFEAARNRQRRINFDSGPVAGKRLPESAQSASVWVSPLSIYSEANPRKTGGANVQQVLRISAKRGFLPETIQPRDYGFKHAIVGTTGKGGVNQASGSWVRLSDFPDGWEETAKHFKPLEFIFPDDIEQAVCLLLHGFLVSVGRKGHAIPWAKYDPDEKLFPYPDSYDVIRYDSWSTARSCAGNGSFAIVSVTTPDDWNKPAG